MAKRHKLTIAYQEVCEGYRNGMTIRELGDLHKVSPGTIRNCLVSHGVEMRSRGRKAAQKDRNESKYMNADFWQEGDNYVNAE